MASVKVYQVNFYDMHTDQTIRSRRWFTRGGAEACRGLIVESSGVTVDESVIIPGEQWTEIGFEPAQG